MTILTKNYDSEIDNKLKSYPYRRTHDDIPKISEKTSESSIGDFDIRHTVQDWDEFTILVQI